MTRSSGDGSAPSRGNATTPDEVLGSPSSQTVTDTPASDQTEPAGKPGSTPTQRRLQAQAAAHAKWSKNDPVAGTAPAREAFLGRFIDQVDPERKLTEKERTRRALSARKAYFAGLALKSSKARAARGKAA